MITESDVRCLKSDIEMLLKNMAKHYNMEMKVKKASYKDEVARFIVEFTEKESKNVRR